MERMIIDERTSWEYELKGDYYYPTGRVKRNGMMIPNEPPEENDPAKEQFIGVWGQRHLRYIRQYKKALYFELYMSGKLNTYLADINALAEDFFLRTVKKMSEQEGVTEALKAKDQMDWVKKTNSIRERAMEIVNRELIFI